MLDSLFFRAFKRLVDIVISLFLLFIFSPFFLLIGLAIKMNSRGPVFFRQTRIGKMGKPFTFYKFRSMIVNNDDSLHRSYTQDFIKNGKPAAASEQKVSYKIKNDPRVTNVGKLLRATSVDELPQLFNVLKGEMSLVGPRPCMPYEWEHYDDWHKKRLSVTPGCTGLWQVSGRSAVGFDDMVLLDLFYINNMSPWFDLQLIIKTIPVMIFARGAH
jgi:lipopolysaccharide/colanic/teichoic acid biosynthesis glycosyltransferase